MEKLMQIYFDTINRKSKQLPLKRLSFQRFDRNLLISDKFVIK